MFWDQGMYTNIAIGSGSIALLHGLGHRLLAMIGSDHRLQSRYAKYVVGSGNIALLHGTGHRLLALIGTDHRLQARYANIVVGSEPKTSVLALVLGSTLRLKCSLLIG